MNYTSELMCLTVNVVLIFIVCRGEGDPWSSSSVWWSGPFGWLAEQHGQQGTAGSSHWCHLEVCNQSRKCCSLPGIKVHWTAGCPPHQPARGGWFFSDFFVEATLQGSSPYLRQSPICDQFVYPLLFTAYHDSLVVSVTLPKLPSVIFFNKLIRRTIRSPFSIPMFTRGCFIGGVLPATSPLHLFPLAEPVMSISLNFVAGDTVHVIHRENMKYALGRVGEFEDM